MQPKKIVTMAIASVFTLGVMVFADGVAHGADAAAGAHDAASEAGGAPTQADDYAVHVSESARAQAANLLRSELGARLSASGRNALRLISAPPRAAMLGGPGPVRAEENGLAPGAVRVNDPSQDAFADRDITTQSETAVAAYTTDQGSTVLVAFNDSGEYLTTHCFMGYSRSTNGGARFTDMGVVPPSPTETNIGDPGLVVDRQGRFYSSCVAFDYTLPGPFQYRIAIQKSTDGGMTWGHPVYAPPFTPGSFTDKDFIAVDTSDRPTSGNVYVTWTDFASTGGNQLPIVFSRSVDTGAHFSAPIQISAVGTFNQGSEPVVGADGTIYVAWNQDRGQGPYGPQNIVVARSTDGGLSFGAPVIAAAAIPIGFGSGQLAGNFRSNSFPRIDVNPANGEVYVVFASNPPGPDPGDVLFVRSVDRGATWSAPVRVNDDHGDADQWFPDLAVNRDGDIRVFWYDRRGHGDRPGDVLMDVYGASSRDGGRSFGVNQRIRSAGPSQANGMIPAVGYDPLVESTYMGDYNDLKVDTTPTGPGSGFYSAWGDFSRIVTTNGGTRADQDVVFARQTVAAQDADAPSSLENEVRGGGDVFTTSATAPSPTGTATGTPLTLAAWAAPNPSTREVALRYSVPMASDRVRLTIYDLAGREVARPVDESKAAGAYEARWDARRARAAPQIYLYRLEALGHTITGRFTLR